MKGIILAGGSGSRLYPITKAISKQLMPVYDKPMVYYPLSVLMFAGIREILIITSREDAEGFKRLLGDGRELGCRFEYAIQEKPDGLPQAFVIGKEFIGEEKVALILGDNIFYGASLVSLLQSFNDLEGAAIFAYRVADPERYGVVEFDTDYNVLSIEEKPAQPKSNYAVPGLYFCDNTVIEIAESLKLSERGEYEIIDVIKAYLEKRKLKVGLMGRGMDWLDTGTFDSLNDAAEFVRVIEKRQDAKIGCIEEAAYYMKYINRDELLKIASKYEKSGYGSYLQRLAQS
jgi:glucose-1-phosphate thymidylyltransferase